MSRHNKSLFLTACWYHYDLYSIYANLFRVQLDVTNISIILSKNFEKKIVNLSFTKNKFFYFFGFIDLFRVNFFRSYFCKQALFFYEILEILFY
jgi:hypothetical protein